MWKGRVHVASMLLRGADRSRGGLSLGAALSLLALAELGRQHQHAKDDSNDMPTSTSTQAQAHARQWAPAPNVSTCESSKKQSTRLARHSTLRRMEDNSTKASIKSRYDVQWNKILGQGAFGAVYLAENKKTGELVALKKITKKFTDDGAFMQEMNALLHLRQAGGHPNICSLRENFDEGGHYYLILDLVSGGEMFDHLVKQGAYSEADAARLVREVASALSFIHGLDTVHGDLKPENIMLSTENPSDAVVKLVDFGCAQVATADSEFSGESGGGSVGKTPAYCPPEVLDKRRNPSKPLEPSMDMWALGVILYIMLTGVHPYDLTGNATDAEIEHAVVSKKPPPLRNLPITAHLSHSAVDLIEKLMSTNAKKRFTALQMLEHPWVKGETARRDKIADSDKKLSMYRVFKSRIEAKVFADIVNWSDDVNTENMNDVSRRISLIERTFRAFDSGQKGYITTTDLRSLTPKKIQGQNGDDQEKLSLSGFSDLLAENMKNRYLPKGHYVYREGDLGNAMYFIVSGTIEVSTKDGSTAKRGPGDLFGEGALLHPKKIRSATIKCVTPVHAMEISREYFEKYLASSDSGLFLTLREKDKIRKRNRAKTILRLQKNLVEREYKRGERLFDVGEDGDSLFIVERGKVDIIVGNNHVFTATPGNMCGEHSLLTGRRRNACGFCASEGGCMAHEMMGRDFRKLMDLSPDMKASLQDLCLRREFKKAVVLQLNKEFPYHNPREAFDAVCAGKCSDEGLDVEAVGNLMRKMNPEFTDEEGLEMIKVLDLSNSGKVTFDEFKKVFVGDIRTSASI